MNYFKIKLNLHVVYAILEYFPYTDKQFFKNIEDIRKDELFQITLAHSFVQLYKDELIFDFEKMSKHKYIVPIKHSSNKFTEINNIICEQISKILGINLCKNYFQTIDIPYVDIRDEYTKDMQKDIVIVPNEKYANDPVIFFDCCCSTGAIFDCLSKKIKTKENLFLSYGVRFKAESLRNTKILDVNEYEFSIDDSKKNKLGYLVRIYGLFGKKNVEVDFRNRFSILIGENGFGKSTATKLAILALKAFVCDDDESKSTLSIFYFKKIKIYYFGYYKKEKDESDIIPVSNETDNYKAESVNGMDKDFNSFSSTAIKVDGKVKHDKFGVGTIIEVYKTSCLILFEDENWGKRRINNNFFNLLDSNGNIIEKNENLDSTLPKKDKNLVNNIDYFSTVLNNRVDKEESLSNNNKPDLDSNFCTSSQKDYEFKIGYLLIKEFEYKDIIPSKDEIINNAIPNNKNKNKITKIIKKLNEDEYESLIRKIILDDRSIEMDYSIIEMKYRYKYDLSKVDKRIRTYIKKQKQIKYNNYISLERMSISLFDCTFNRNIILALPKDRIKLFNDDDPEDYNPYEDDKDDFYDFYDPETEWNGWDEYFDYDYGCDYKSEIIKEAKDFFEEKYGVEAITYDFGNRKYLINNDLIIEKIYTNIFSLYLPDPLFSSPDSHSTITPKYKEPDISEIFSKNKIVLRYLLREFMNSDLDSDCSILTDSGGVMTKDFFTKDFFGILKLIFYYDELPLNENIIKRDLFDSKISRCFKSETIVNIDISKMLSNEEKNKISKIYEDIFKEKYHYISFGIYDILKKEDFNKLKKIIRRLYVNGIKTRNDYLVVAGLKLLIEAFLESFKSKKHYLLEKLINKYFVNKTVCVYPTTIVISDANNEYIPIDCLSTGERNLIILFLLALSNSEQRIILDEPDLSMSVSWQSKVLVDLLKYTNNKYIITSQSPLLVQKNSLSSFVRRMEFEDEIIAETYDSKFMSHCWVIE